MDFLYKNRRLLVLVFLLIGAAGGFALTRLPRQEDPTLTTRFALILTSLPGASAERVESLVTERIERKILEMPEVKEVMSTSRVGISAVNVEIREDIDDVDPIWSRVRDRLDDLERVFPQGTRKPELKDREHIDTLTMIVALAWRGEGRPNPAVLRRLAEDLSDQLRSVPGTAFAKVYGAPEEEILVAIDRHAAARLGLSPSDIAARIQGSDAKVTAGLVRGAGGDFTMEVSGEIDSLERIRNLVLGTGPSGQTLRLRDIARLEKGVEDPPSEVALIDGRLGVTVGAKMRQTERTDLWAAKARRTIAAYAEVLPEALELRVVFDQSLYVEARLHELARNFLLGVLFVLVVTLVLMGWRASIVVAVTLPLASLMVFAGLFLMKVPIQQMSVMGLIIALGMLIDNAIIMTDEVGHLMRTGRSASDAIRFAVRALTVPLLGSTLTTVLAFLPMVLVEGATGEFIRSIGISVILAVTSSLVLALTVVPALVGLLGGVRIGGPRWAREGISPGLFARPYRFAIRLMLDHPVVAMLLAAALPAFGFMMASRLPEQFFPPADRDQMRVVLELPPSAGMHQTLALTQQVDAILRADDTIAHTTWMVGRNAPKFYYNMMSGREGSANFAECLVQLEARLRSFDGVHALQALFDAQFPEALILVKPLEQGPPFDAPIELRVLGPDLAVLQRVGEDARRILASVPDVIHTRVSVGGTRPKVEAILDESALARTGLSNRDVAGQLYDGLEGVRGGSLLEASEELPIKVRLARGAREDLDDVASVDLFPTRGGESPRRPTSLSAVGRLTLVPEEGSVTRLDGRRFNSVQGVITAGMLPAVVLARTEKALADADFELPVGYEMRIAGEAEERDDAVGKLMASVSVLVLMMIGVLVLSFSSFRLAGVILMIGGLSIGLGLLALWVFDQNFGFMAISGVMGLVGLAINDSIAVLAGLQKDPDVVRGDVGAAERVVFRSTRHVISTTVTTIAGFLPLILAGGQLWPPLAISIAGGVAGATLLALFFLPAAYRRLMMPRP